jgi:hypothetical protein
MINTCYRRGLNDPKEFERSRSVPLIEPGILRILEPIGSLQTDVPDFPFVIPEHFQSSILAASLFHESPISNSENRARTVVMYTMIVKH